MVSVLCIGDPHFQDSNMKDVLELIPKLVEHAKRLQPTFIVCLGDILHTHEKIFVTPFKAATRLIKELSEIAPTYLLIGNHDYKNNTQFLTTEHAFNSLKSWKNTYVVDTVIEHEYGGKKFVFLPYVFPGRFKEALASSGYDWELATAIFAHQEFYGCKFGAMISTSGDNWSDDFPLVISGHIHDSQWVDKKVFYTGSILQHGYGESSEKYLWHVEMNDTPKFNPIELEMKKRKIIHIDYDDLTSFKPEKYENYHLKLDVKGTAEQFKRFKQGKLYRELAQRGIKIMYTPINTNALALRDEVMKGLEQQNISFRRNRSYITILKELTKNESKLVHGYLDEITKDYINEEFEEEIKEMEEHVDLALDFEEIAAENYDDEIEDIETIKFDDVQLVGETSLENDITFDDLSD